MALLLVLFPALLSTACFDGDDGLRTERPGDTDPDADTDADADTDTDTDADTDADTDVYTTASIPEIQQGELEVGTLVRLEQVVVVGSQLSDGFHVASLDEPGAWSGLWLAADDELATVVEGDVLRVSGEVRELETGGDPPAGDGSLTAVVLDQQVDLLSQDSAPAPVGLGLAELADPEDAEAYEGVLVRLEALTVTEGGIGTWVADDQLEVHDLYVETTALTGASLDALTGVLWYSQGSFRLCPRAQSDLEGYEPLLEDCGEAACMSSLEPGALAVTEVMRDPEAVYDDLGEWLEVLNTGEAAVDLRGLEVLDDDGDAFVVADSVVLEAGAYAVLAASADPHANGGVSASWDYPYARFTLADGTDEVILSYGDVIFDRVAWDDGVTFPALAGASMALDPDHLDADSNDDGANWCAASTPYGDGDLGSPGSANPPCVE